MPRLQLFRERLTLALLVLLPLHALLVTVLTKVIAGPGIRPLPILALWKESLLALILVLAMTEIIPRFRTLLSIDAIDAVILFALAYAVGVTYFSVQNIFSFTVALGFKYDFIPLIAFFILRRVSWSPMFLRRALSALVTIGVVIAIYGILTLFFPLSFFTTLGYSDLHSLYVADGALAAFQQIGGTAVRRMQSTMSGPNQLGMWLLIPLGIILGNSVAWSRKTRMSQATFFLLLLALFFTYSRAAWIGGFAMVVLSLVSSVSARQGRKTVTWFLSVAVGLLVIAGLLFPSIFLRIPSSSDHLRRPIEALQIILKHPFGLGLGTAGPATNAVSDTCIDLPAGSDATWATQRQDLCVFVGGVRVGLSGKECRCPLLTENWYLQWGIEMGWIGFILSMSLPLLILKKRSMRQGHQGAGLAFIGICSGGLFLHAFEDAAVAVTVWILLAAVSRIHLDDSSI